MSYFLLILLVAFPALAALDNIQIKNLDLNYVYPQGSGEVEKLSIGVATKNQPQGYQVEIYRREKSFDILSPHIDFQWLKPIEFVHHMLSAETKKLNLKIDTGDHFARGESLKITGEKTGEFVFLKYDVSCAGPSVAEKPVDRLKTDCLEKMNAAVSHMELPFQFLKDIAEQLPDIATETQGDIPANDFSLIVKKGDFSSYLRIKYVVAAYLKIWGHAQFENDGKTFAIRVDSIKYGILPVTTLVMNELRRQINHPDVTITPPWIRINLGK